MSEDIKKLILDKRREGKLVYTSFEGLHSVAIKDFIRQPVDGILYDLNRLEEVALTFIDDPKWVNDFAVALTIRELYALIESLRSVARAAKLHTEEDAPETWDNLSAALDALPQWVLESE